MGWLIKNGSYPYPENLPAMPETLASPYPVTIWGCSANTYPTCGLFPENPALGCFANAVKLRTVRYSGTMAQWHEVQQGTQWRSNAPFDRIICKDGELLQNP